MKSNYDIVITHSSDNDKMDSVFQRGRLVYCDGIILTDRKTEIIVLCTEDTKEVSDEFMGVFLLHKDYNCTEFGKYQQHYKSDFKPYKGTVTIKSKDKI